MNLGIFVGYHRQQPPRVDMRWPTDGKRKRGRTKETWRPSVEGEIKEKGWSWGELVKLVKDKKPWLSLVTTLICGHARRGLSERIQFKLMRCKQHFKIY